MSNDNLKRVSIVAEYLSLYYGLLSDQKQRWYSALSLAAILSSLGAAVVLLVSWPVWITAVLFMTVSVIMALMLVYDFSRRSQIAKSVSEQCREIFIELKYLWLERDDLKRRQNIQALERRLDTVTRVELVVDDQLSKECYDRAEKDIDDEYPRQEGLAEAAQKREA